MTHRSWLPILALSLASGAEAHSRGAWEVPARLVAVSIEVDGHPAPLFPASDGCGRYYLEALPDSTYVVRLANRTGERLGVVLAVDGLNVISGERDPGTESSHPGRMYVLDPWETTLVQGWRTSLNEVRRFTFVDEAVSYAARSGKANGKMGWIELVVFRERPQILGYVQSRRDQRERAVAEADGTPPASAPSREEKGRDKSARPEARSYPGTGWGDRADDRVEMVDFSHEARAAERITLRYEYAATLRTLGIRPDHPYRDRLRERERGVDGFARPPAW